MTERPNIRRMQIPERRAEEFAFDPQKELNNDFWEKILYTFGAHKSGFLHTMYIAESLTLLGERRSFEISPEEWSDIHEYLGRPDHDEEDYAALLARMKIVDPSHSISLTDETWQTLREKLLEISVEENAVRFARIAKHLKILKPAERVLSLEEIVHIESAIATCRTDNRWTDFPTLVDALSIIDPSIELDISDTDWKKMHERLNDFLTGQSWVNAATQAAEMYAIAQRFAKRKKSAKVDAPLPESIEI